MANINWSEILNPASRQSRNPSAVELAWSSVFPSYPRYNIANAVDYLKKNYQPKSIHSCAKYVRLALEAGGGNTKGYPNMAKLYKPTLEQIGYKKLEYSPKDFQIGDIVVFQPPYPEQMYGHIQMWDGLNWGSDFRQNNFYPSSQYRTNPMYEIFRYETNQGVNSWLNF